MNAWANNEVVWVVIVVVLMLMYAAVGWVAWRNYRLLKEYKNQALVIYRDNSTIPRAIFVKGGVVEEFKRESFTLLYESPIKVFLSMR